jgi:hypothetical protein
LESSKISCNESLRLQAAIKNYKAALMELGNAIDETGYCLSSSAPIHMSEIDDYTYEVISWSDDEIEEIKKSTHDEAEVHNIAAV